MSLCDPLVQILTRPKSNINFKLDPKVVVDVDKGFEVSQKKQELNSLMIMQGGAPIDLKEMHPTINDLPRYIDITGRSPEEIDAFKTKLLTQIDAKCEIQTKNEPPKILTGGKSRYKKKKRTIKKRKSYRKQKKGKYNRTKSRK